MQEYKESTLFLFLGTILYSSLFFYGAIVRLLNEGAGDMATIQQMYAVAQQTGIGMQQLQLLLVISTFILSLINLLFAFFIQKAKHPILCLLLFVIGFMSLLCIVGTLIFGKSPFVNFFVACCGVMAYFAYVLDLTYKEFCVLGNIFLQSLICLIAALAPVLAQLRKPSGTRSTLKTTISIINLSIHGALFVIICSHYWMPLEQSFDLCYGELYHLAATTGSTYIMVNLVIFVILFLGDLIYNALLYQFAKQE